MQVERADAASGAAARVAVERDDHARPVVALDHPRGHDPDHARVPPLPGEHVRGRLGVLGTGGLGLEQDARLGVLALAVEEVELVGDVGRATLVVGQHELEGGIGPLEPAGGVQARREPEPERVLGRGTRLDAGDLHQRPQPRLRGARQRGQALAHEAAVLTLERHHVGHGCQADQIEVLGEHVRVAPGDPEHRLGELVRHGRGAQLRERVVAERRMHDRAVGQLVGRPVVVGDDDLEPELARACDLGRRGDRAVDRDEQSRARRRHPLDGLHRQPVSVGAARYVPARIGPEPAQGAHEDRGGADAVDVVVAVHDDLRALRDVAEDRLAALVHAGERERVVALVGREEVARGLRGVVPAPREDRGRGRGDAERARELIRRGDGVGRAGPARRRRHRRDPAPRFGRNGPAAEKPAGEPVE